MLSLVNVIREETTTRTRRHSQEKYCRQAAGYLHAMGIPLNQVGHAGYRKSLILVAATLAYESGMPDPEINRSSVNNALNGVGTKDNDTAEIKSHAESFKLQFANWLSEAEKSGNPTEWIVKNRPGYRFNTEPDGSVKPKRDNKGEITVPAVSTYTLSPNEAMQAYENLKAIVN